MHVTKETKKKNNKPKKRAKKSDRWTNRSEIETNIRDGGRTTFQIEIKFEFIHKKSFDGPYQTNRTKIHRRQR